MIFRNSLIALLSAVTLVGCQQNQQQGQKGGQGAEGGDGTSDGSFSGGVDFDAWCEMASSTSVIRSKLSSYFSELCDDGAPTALLTSTLPRNAYDGTGKPKFKSIQQVKSDANANTTSYLFGVGIKLPISIKAHFDKVAAKAGDTAAQEAMAEKNGGEVEVEIKKKFSGEEKYHVRGWQVHTTEERQKSGVDITTETETRTDHFQFASGSLYMYTQYTIKGIKTIKKFDTITAGFKADDGSYLVTVAYVLVDNKGFPKDAEVEIKSTAANVVIQNYEAALGAQ